MHRFLPLVLPVPCHQPITVLHKKILMFYLTEQLPGNDAKMLGVILTRLIHLIFNYRLGLVGLEFIKNICEGRFLRHCRSILTNKRSKDISK